MLALNFLLTLIWAALTGDFGPLNLMVGFAIGYATLWLTKRPLDGEAYFRKSRKLVKFVFFVFWELVLANIKVARMVLTTPVEAMRPGIIAVPLDVKSDAAITMLANLITLTPGTLSLDVSDDRQVLYVHTIELADAEAFRQSTKHGFERLVREVFE
jgi:multicomponent Na+:H+ antiporter subunit E